MKISFFTLLTFIVCLYSCNKNEHNIPAFSYKTLNNNHYNNSDLPKNREIIFCYVDSHCPSCMKFLEELNQHAESENKFFVVVFNKKKDESFKNVVVLRTDIIYLFDSEDNFSHTFGLGIFVDFPTFVYFNGAKKIISTDKNAIFQ